MNLIVIGAGYVGCVSAACFAKIGHNVVVVEIVPDKINAINLGKSPVVEPGLNELVKSQVLVGRLRATDSFIDIIGWADAAVICVATPSTPSGFVDTRPIRRVFTQLIEAMDHEKKQILVVVRSTITAPVLKRVVRETGGSLDKKIRLVVNPEFLRETSAIEDFFQPPFIIAGGEDADDVSQAIGIYIGIDAPRYQVDLETASLIKYSCNAFHALKVAFTNEIASVATMVGADPLVVMKIFAQDHILNISSAYLKPGFAFGGSCLPKDTRALSALGREMGEPLSLIGAILKSNARRIEQAVEAIMSHDLQKLGMMGISFKSGTDDLRESPYLALAERLVAEGHSLKIFDPDVDPKKLVGVNVGFARQYLPSFEDMIVNNPEEFLNDIDGLVLCKPLLNKKLITHLEKTKIPIFDIEYIATQSGLQQLQVVTLPIISQ